VPTARLVNDLSKPHYYTSVHPKDSRSAVPTARLANDLCKPHHYTSIHSKDSRFAVPIVRLANDLRKPHYCTSLHSKDSRFAVPIARLANDLRKPHKRTSVHPKGIRFASLPLIHADHQLVPTGNTTWVAYKMKNKKFSDKDIIMYPCYTYFFIKLERSEIIPVTSKASSVASIH
jgi:hypothetical protein